MFDIDKELEKWGLTRETYKQLLEDCYNKSCHQSDKDWGEIATIHKLNWNSDSLRKSSTSILGGSFVKQFVEEEYAESSTSMDEDEYFKKLQIMKDEIYKEKRKLYDQRRERNKDLIVDARSEHLFDEMIKCANKLNEERPLNFEETFVPVNSKKEAILVISDWHYGMTTDNIWNTYNTEICKKRVKKLIEYVKNYLQLNQIDMLNIVTLGDSAHGAIHSSCRVQSEEDTCDQIMHVAEIMAEMFSELSKCVNHITVYSCYGNHLRTVQDKMDSIDSDNMEKIIPWWWEQRLKDNSKIDINYSEYKEFTKFSVLGYNVCAVHGNLDTFKNIGITVNTLFSKKFGETIDYTLSGDKHHLEEFEQYGIESILVRGLCGTDSYANDKRLYGKAGQTLMIFNNKYGRESTYHIPLD